MSATIRINGKDEPFVAGTVQQLLERLGVDPNGRGAAVALNGAVVPRRDWTTRRLDASDEVDVVRPYAGG